MKVSPINKVIEDFEKLNLEDKEYASQVLVKAVTEAKRQKIAQRAEEVRENYRRGSAKSGSVEDLIHDLESDETRLGS